MQQPHIIRRLQYLGWAEQAAPVPAPQPSKQPLDSGRQAEQVAGRLPARLSAGSVTSFGTAPEHTSVCLGQPAEYHAAVTLHAQAACLQAGYSQGAGDSRKPRLAPCSAPAGSALTVADYLRAGRLQARQHEQAKAFASLSKIDGSRIVRDAQGAVGCKQGKARDYRLGCKVSQKPISHHAGNLSMRVYRVWFEHGFSEQVDYSLAAEGLNTTAAPAPTCRQAGRHVSRPAGLDTASMQPAQPDMRKQPSRPALPAPVKFTPDHPAFWFVVFLAGCLAAVRQ